MPPWVEHPYSLVSLYYMIHVYADKFVRAIAIVAEMSAAIKGAKAAGFRVECPDDVQHQLTASLTQLCGQLEEINLTMSHKTASRLLAAMVDRNVNEYGSLMDELQHRLIDELDSVTMLVVPSNRKAYYDSAEAIFGDDVMAKFPSAAREAEEARKCYALGRNTACVFHLMRILELGLNCLAQALHVSFDRRNWEHIINDIEKKIQSIGPADGATWKNEEQFYSEAAVQFRYLKNAWRNHVMHIRDSHDEDSAMEIMNHVRGLTRHLATRLRE